MSDPSQLGQPEDNALSRSVARSVGFNSVGKVVSLGLNLLITPFVLHHLTAAQYGLWVLVMSVAGYANLLDLGVNGAVVKYVAEHSGTGDHAASRSTLATALWIYAVLAATGTVLSAVAAAIFPHLFAVQAAERTTAVWLMFLVGVSVSFALPCTLASSTLRGLQRFDLMNLLTTAGALLGTGATVLTLAMGGRLLALAAANFVTMLLMQIPNVIVVRRVAPELHFGSFRGADRRAARSIFRFSAAVSVIEVAGRMQTKSDELVIGAFLSISAVTPYSLGRRLSELPQLLTDQFLKVLLPIASQLHAKGELERHRRLFLASTRITLAMFLPLAGALAILAPSILTLWVGKQYAWASSVTAVLVTASLFNTAMWPAASILQSMMRHRPMAISAMASAVANVLLSIWLGKRYGLIGVAYGTLIPTVLECACFILPYTMRLTGTKLVHLWREVALPVALPTANLFVCLWLIDAWLPPSTLAGLAAACVASGAVYLATYYFTGASTLEHNFLFMRRSAAVSVR